MLFHEISISRASIEQGDEILKLLQELSKEAHISPEATCADKLPASHAHKECLPDWLDKDKCFHKYLILSF